jgi:hypothetical protein
MRNFWGMDRSIWGRTPFFDWIKKDRSVPEEPERVILKQTPPYNLYGVSHFSHFQPETAEYRLSNGSIEP